MIIAVITDNFWQNLKEVVDCPQFNTDKYDTQPGRLADKEMIDANLAQIFAGNTTEYWLERLNEKRIPCAPVNKFSQALNDEQVRYRNMVVELKHPSGKSTQGPGNPIKFSRTNEESFAEAPLVGQHTDEVLQRLLGYSADEIEAMRLQEVIK